MDDITARYGARVPLTIEIDAADAVSATLYVGNAGETPVITKTANFTEGDIVNDVQLYEADLSLLDEETKVPLGEYSYQINVTYPNGDPDKFPDPSTCDDNALPTFTIVEALDETEVT